MFNEQANGDKQTDYASYFSTFDIKVDHDFVTNVKLNKRSTVMLAGNTETLTATISPESATNKKVIWSSSDTGVATMDENGKVTAKAPGTAIITADAEGAKDGDRAAACFVTVLTRLATIVPGASAVSEAYAVVRLLRGPSRINEQCWVA